MLLAAATARTATQTAFEQVRAIIAQLPGLIAVTRGPQHAIVFANPAFARAAGCCEKDLIGRPAGAVLAELWGPGDGERLDQVYRTGTPSPVMEWCGPLDREGDGTSRAAVWRVVLRPMRTATGAVSGVLIHATDITEWVQARRGFEEFMAGSVSRRPQEWLPAHVGPAEAGHGPRTAAAGAAIAAGGGGAAGAVATGEPVGQIATDGPSVSVVERRRAYRRRADEERVRLLAQAQEALAQTQEALAQAREAHREAQQARDAAEAAVQTRAEFLSSATHDLRVPLTTTMGRAHMVQRRLLARDAIDQTWLCRQMEALCDASRRMLAAVNEMNDVAGLQMGHALDLDREPVDVGMVLYTVADDAGAQHGRRVVDVEAPIGAVVMGDRARLERVMHNIVGNAIKYSAGRTPICVEARQDDAWVTVTVRDRGVGIPADEVPHVFTHFYRASTAIGVPGSGIGLAGARTIVEQHGGHITLHSILGEGTTVTITLPRAGHRPEGCG